MSGKFKKDVARSQTLSYISSFAGVEETSREQQLPASCLTHSDNNHRKIKAHDFNQAFPNSKRAESLRLSPCQAKSFSCNMNNLMKNLDIVINANSEYDLDKDSVAQSRESLELDAAFPSSHFGAKQNHSQKGSLFKQSITANMKKNLQSSLFSASQLDFPSNITDIPANLATSQDQDQDNRFNKLMDFLNVPSNTNDLCASNYGSACSSKVLKMNENFREKDCSIIYNSCQVDMSCSVSMKITNESRRLYQKQQKDLLLKKNSMAEEDEENSMFSSNPQYHNRTPPTIEQQKEIIKEYTESTISKLNHLNNKIQEVEQLDHQDLQLSKKTSKYISKKLRLLKRAPFSSVQLSSQLVTSSSVSQMNSQKQLVGESQHSFSSNQDYQTFYSNQPSIVKRNSHFISKISLDIEYLVQKDICLTTDELYTFVLPLDPHFPNVILVGTLSGKIQLYSLSKENPRKRYILKLSSSIYPKSEEGLQVYPTCAVQYKSNFFIGGSDGSVLLYDFKKKAVVCKRDNTSDEISEGNTLEVPDMLSFKMNAMCFNSSNSCNNNEDNEEEQSKKSPFSINYVNATETKLIFTRKDGLITIVDSANLNQTILVKRAEGLIKCDFSCDSENNIVILTDEKLEVFNVTLEKTVFKMKPNIQEHLVYADFSINKLTKEILLLSNNQIMMESKIQILRNTSTRLRVIDSLHTPYLINSVLFDKSMQNMFCVCPNEIKIWSYFNQAEYQKIQQSLVEKLSDPEDILTTNDSCN